jgi:hypothetical protein
MAMLGERVDAAMDEVVRELTAGEPGAAFTARVLARIDAEASGTRTRPKWRAAWVMSPLALAAAIVVGAAVFRGGSTKPVPHPQPTAGIEDNGRTAAVEAAPAVTDSARVAFQLPTRRLDTASRLDSPNGLEIDALALAPLDVVSIKLSELEPLTSIDLEQLHTIEPIAVTPLGDDHEGDRP